MASGCSARPLRTTLPVAASHTITFVDWVDESTPATRTALLVITSAWPVLPGRVHAEPQLAG